MVDNKKVTIQDVPPAERRFLETRAGNAVYGTNGISHSLANTHLVIMAIHNALGVWADPPASPDKQHIIPRGIRPDALTKGIEI